MIDFTILLYLHSLTADLQCPLSRLSTIYVKFYLGLLRSSKSLSHLLRI